MAIKIDFLSNTRPAARGVEELGDALDDVGSSLDDVARDAQRSGDRVADAYEDAARDGERSAERLERSFREASDATARASHAASRDMADSYTSGARDAGEGLSTVREEANSTARESAASFDGSAESIVSSFQEVAANAFAGFGPAGALAGLAAAAGIGIVMAQIDKGSENTEEFKAKVQELGQQFIETGGIGDNSLSDVSDRIKDMATSTEDGVVNLKDLAEWSDKSRSNVKDLAQAFAGNSDELERQIKLGEENIERLREQAVADNDVTGGINRAATDTERRIEAQQKINDKLVEARSVTEQATAADAAYAAVGGPELAAKAEAAEDYAEAVQGAYADAGAAIDDYVEEGVFNLQKYTEESQKQADAVAGYQLNMVTLSQTLSDEALAYVASLGPEAAPLIDAFVKAPLAQQQATGDVWSTLGQTSTDAFGVKVQKNLNGSSFQSTVVLNPDATKIRDYLNTVKTQNVLLRVQNRIDLPARQGMGVP